MSEIIAKDTVSEMQRTVDALVDWSEVNHMNVNSKKTKEMVLSATQQVDDATSHDRQPASTGDSI